jgi:hypothetical protein
VGGGGGGGEYDDPKQQQHQNETLQAFSKFLEDTLVDEIDATFTSQNKQQRMRQLRGKMHEIETLGMGGKIEQSLATFLTLPSTQTNQNLLLLGRLYFIKGLLLHNSFTTPQQKIQHLERIEKELDSTPWFIFIRNSRRGPTILAWNAVLRQYEMLKEEGQIKQQKVNTFKKRFQQKLKELGELDTAVVKVIHLPNKSQAQQSRQEGQQDQYRQKEQHLCSLSTVIEIMYDTIQKGLKESSIFITPSTAFSKILAVLFHYEKELDSCLKKRISLSRKSYNRLIMLKEAKVNHGDVIFIPMEPLKKQEGFLYSPDSIYRGHFKNHPADKDTDIPLFRRREGWGWYEHLDNGEYSNRIVMRIGEFKEGVLYGKGLELHYDYGDDGHQEELQKEVEGGGKAMIRIGEWVDGEMVFGRILFHNGDMYYGEMKKDELCGQGYMLDHETRSVIVGTFSENKLKKKKKVIPILQDGKVSVNGTKKIHQLVPGILDYMKNLEKEMDFDMYLKKIIKRHLQQKKAGGGGGGVTRQQVKRSFQQQLRRQHQKTKHLHWIGSPSF